MFSSLFEGGSESMCLMYLLLIIVVIWFIYLFSVYFVFDELILKVMVVVVECGVCI